MPGTSEGGDAALVSGSYFSVLGLTPHLGRLLEPDDDRQPGSGQVVVLSYDYWQRRFGARSDVIGQPVRVNGQPMTIVGVAPQGFHGTTFGERPRIYVPISMREHVVPRWKGLDDRRVVLGVPLRAAQARCVQRSRRKRSSTGSTRSIHTTVDVPLQQGMNPSMLERYRNMEMPLEPGALGQSRAPDEAGGPLTLLFGVTAFVLLICCANVANLLLGRAAARATEMAVRLSIGAGRRHIVAQLLTESMLLAVAGGLAGLVVARWTLNAMQAILPSVSALSWHVDGEMVLFAAMLSLATGVLFGLFPALHSSRPNLVTALKANAGQPAERPAPTMTMLRAPSSMRAGFVVGVLEDLEQPGPQRLGVVDGVQREGVLLGARRVEEVRARSGGDHQVVAGERLAVRRRHRPRRRVDRGHGRAA